MPEGKFIILDGIDGVGKTTHCKALKQWLVSQGYSVVLTQEPTNRKIGSMIRDIIKTEKTFSIIDALLFAADRIDHLENIVRPALAANKIVISDRYYEASIAYQTAAGAEMSWILKINKFAEAPDLIIILNVDPEIGLSRKAKIVDKFEDIKFLCKVREIYLKRAKTQNYPIINTNRPIDQVQADIRELIQAIL